jgi:hypothetical protein
MVYYERYLSKLQLMGQKDSKEIIQFLKKTQGIICVVPKLIGEIILRIGESLFDLNNNAPEQKTHI